MISVMFPVICTVRHLMLCSVIYLLDHSHGHQSSVGDPFEFYGMTSNLLLFVMLYLQHAYYSVWDADQGARQFILTS